MDLEELPQFDSNVDYTEIEPICNKRLVTFVNHFIMNTVGLLNHFVESCETRLVDFDYKLQKVEASLLILESQLASIPDEPNRIENIVIENKEQLDLPEIINEDSNIVTTEDTTIKVEDTVNITTINGTQASKHPTYEKFFKMVQFGVPAQAVKLKMNADGLDPNILDNPQQIIPD